MQGLLMVMLLLFQFGYELVLRNVINSGKNDPIMKLNIGSLISATTIPCRVRKSYHLSILFYDKPKNVLLMCACLGQHKITESRVYHG